MDNLCHIATIIAANEGDKPEFVSLLGHSYNKKENNFGNSENIKIKNVRYERLLKTLSLGYTITSVRIESNNPKQFGELITVNMRSLDGREISYPGLRAGHQLDVNLIHSDVSIYINGAVSFVYKQLPGAEVKISLYAETLNRE